MNPGETTAGLPLQLVGLAGGLLAATVAIWLARNIPQRMEREVKPRPSWWWAIGFAVGGYYGWLLAANFDIWALLPALLAFCGATLGLALIDLDHQLIPNRVLFPSTAVVAALLVVGAVIEGEPGALVRAALGAVAYFAFLLVVAVIARGGFGMGDVKLAFLLGMIMAFVSWRSFVVGLVGAVLLGGIASGLLLLFGRKGRKAKFAYGPYLVLGAWVAIVWGNRIADWYLRTG